MVLALVLSLTATFATQRLVVEALNASTYPHVRTPSATPLACCKATTRAAVDACSVMDPLEMPPRAHDLSQMQSGLQTTLVNALMASIVIAVLSSRRVLRTSHRHITRQLMSPWSRLGLAAASLAMPLAAARHEEVRATAMSCSESTSAPTVGLLLTVPVDRVLPFLSVVVLLLILRKLSHIDAQLRKTQVASRLGGTGPNEYVASGAARPCPEAMQRGTEPSAHWAAVSGTWVVDRREGDVDAVLGLVGYGPIARSAFKLAQYGRGVAELEIQMHDGRHCTLTFGGGPMPKTSNTMRVDGTVQTFVGNEGIPGDDEYRVAMWWEGDEMVAWGEHKSDRFPRMDTRRYLRDGLDGTPHGELIVERTVAGVFSRMIYKRRR